MVSELQRFDAADFRSRASRHSPDDEVTGPGPTYLAHGDHALNADMVLGIDQARDEIALDEVNGVPVEPESEGEGSGLSP